MSAAVALTLRKGSRTQKEQLGRTVKGFQAWHSKRTRPQGASSVQPILTDDVGFGVPGTFGGPIPKPTLNKLGS
jgi:arylsulfatase